VLAAAFHGYPLAQWLVGKDLSAQTRLISLFRTLFALPAAEKFDIETAADGNAIAVWLASEQLPLFTAADGRPALQRFRRELGPRAAHRLFRFQLASDGHHGGGPFDYLFLLAVRPDMQRHGLGSGLLGSHLERSKALNRRVVLETADASNLQFYRRFNFKVIDRYRVSQDSPVTWVMDNKQG
jgi:GNAT superfamily N-acetyltransferase